MAEFPMRKIKILVIICLCIILLESILGFATLYTGFLYREVDTKTAVEMLEIIKSTDKNYYEKLVDPENNEYLKEFESVHTKHGNKLLIICGIIVIAFSFGCLIPIAIILNSILNVGKEKAKESSEEETKEETKEETEEAEKESV